MEEVQRNLVDIETLLKTVVFNKVRSRKIKSSTLRSSFLISDASVVITTTL